MNQIIDAARFEKKLRLTAFDSYSLRHNYIVLYNLELDASIR